MIEDRSAPWDEAAQTMDDAPDHGLHDPETRRAWLDLLLPLLDGEGRCVADVGSGTGTLSILLTEAGHRVDGVDFSREMVRLARAKASSLPYVPAFIQADVEDPPLRPGSYDAVLCRHVLWTMPDPAAALANWIRLLKPAGRLILIEGNWSTGAGLTATECARLVSAHRQDVRIRPLDDPTLWGGAITDERYLLVSDR